MAYFVRLHRGGRKVGELGPFRSKRDAVRQAQPLADDAAPGVVVSVERTRTYKAPSRKKNPSALVVLVLERLVEAAIEQSVRVAKMACADPRKAARWMASAEGQKQLRMMMRASYFSVAAPVSITQGNKILRYIKTPAGQKKTAELIRAACQERKAK